MDPVRIPMDPVGSGSFRGYGRRIRWIRLRGDPVLKNIAYRAAHFAPPRYRFRPWTTGLRGHAAILLGRSFASRPENLTARLARAISRSPGGRISLHLLGATSGSDLRNPTLKKNRDAGGAQCAALACGQGISDVRNFFEDRILATGSIGSSFRSP